MIDVLLVHRPGILRETLQERLERERDLRVASAFESGSEVPALLDTAPGTPVVVCEASLFDPNDGQRWSAGGAAVVLVAEPADERNLVPAVVAGVRGWTSKNDPYELLLAAIRCVADGGTSIPPELLTLLLAELTVANRASHAASKLALLTARERQVLNALAEGQTRAEVAASLHVSTNTVRTHVRRILAKLDVHSALTAVALGRRLGVLDSPQ